ncbi:MAG TPA: 16S rRNA (adenine(1518)-N(6)/adenine(1519)-N(6))-dimethyltransferase RsmA [Vicinamibacterales bacterium]|nr:16S rRNA (adenine(1518)-N(6)/adenine(1519)-N(6))-dimethyltransferase RsmA [Vicinamibacterales bacterium]
MKRARGRTRRFAQHFLAPAWARKVVEVIAPGPDDVFVEIGPGRGVLTRPLAERARRVVAVEIDRDLARELRASVPPNVTVVEADVLAADLEALVGSEGRYRVAGNLPYNISSPVLFKLVDTWRRHGHLADAVLMLQREVADRVAAPPGSRAYGALSALVQLHADVSRRLVVPPGAFRPAPQVVSAVVHLVFRPPRVPVSDPAVFERLTRRIFERRRKTLRNALAPVARAGGRSVDDLLARAGLDPRRRPETLGLEELARLADALAGRADAPPVL